MKDFCKLTKIHTQISTNMRISSIWRTWGNEYFESEGWETFVWKDKEMIEQHTSNNYEDCIELHNILYEKWSKTLAEAYAKTKEQE